MTRLFLAAGVAALAIAVPASAKPGGGNGGGHGGGQAQAEAHGGGGGHGGGAAALSGGGGGRVHGGGGFAAFSGGGGRGHGGGFAVQRQSFARGGGGGQGHAFASFDRPHGGGGGNAHVQRMNRVERQQGRGNVQRFNRVEQAHGNAQRLNRVERTHGNGQVRAAERQQVRENRMVGRNPHENRVVVQNGFDRERIRDNNVIGIREAKNFAGGRGYGVGGCPPGLMSKGCMPPGQALQANRIANEEAFRASRLAAMTLGAGAPILSPYAAERFIGAPLSTIGGAVPLMAFPSNLSYLYPDTPDYYYRYGGGYLYQVDRDTALVNALLPLLGGGILPGQYLPTSYMSSYVPNYYGFNSFYPSSYGYGGLCNRYANGVIYQVDCATGFVEDVVPMYASGYGVGQMLPSGYGYYNVPYQYRSTYYNTPDYNYWYAPGAIYQYDPGTSMITSVASLLTPGFSIGQQLPMGYSAYNVPYAYRQTYYDTPDAWYRYNNGYIYQVDPVTQLVTAIVASILT